MRGNRSAYGTFRIFTQRPIRGRFNSSSRALPMYMEATVPQKMWGASFISNGPTCSPWTINAPSRMAITALAGIPSVSMGMNAAPVAAVLAVSGPAPPPPDVLFQVQQPLRDPEESHDHRHQPHAVDQLRDAVGEPVPPADGIHP